MPKKQKKELPITEKLTIDLTDIERANLDEVAAYHGRLSVGAAVRMMIADWHRNISAVRVMVSGQVMADKVAAPTEPLDDLPVPNYNPGPIPIGAPRRPVCLEPDSLRGQEIPLASGGKISFGKKTRAEVNEAIARAASEMQSNREVEVAEEIGEEGE